jgi:hypothetical protein
VASLNTVSTAGRSLALDDNDDYVEIAHDTDLILADAITIEAVATTVYGSISPAAAAARRRCRWRCSPQQ